MDNELEIELLNSKRFDPEANLVYQVPLNRLPKKQTMNDDYSYTESVDFENEETLKVILEFMQHHIQKQVPRIQQLRRYYNGRNDIKLKRRKPDEFRADNRISSDFVRFITTFKRGVVVGNPIEYAGSDKIMTLLDDFNERANESYHNQMMVQDMVLFGRAYELPYRNWQAKESITKLKPENTFIIYDTTVDKNSICGVHHYKVKYLLETTYVIEIYGNDGFIYTFESKERASAASSLTMVGTPRNTYTNAVSINEWTNNEERHGDCDAVLDDIDAYDLAQSELANFMQDSSDAYLVIVGNPDTGRPDPVTGKDKSVETLKEMRKARMLVLGDKKIYGDGTAGAEPNAFYLKKEYDSTGAEAYKDRLVADILRFAFVVDFTDDTIGGNQTGIGMRFKGWGNDNDRSTKENVIKKAIMRRIRLLASSWAIKETIEPNAIVNTVKRIKEALTGTNDTDKLYELVNDVTMKFNANIPRSDEELVSNAKELYGVVSDQTLFEILETITGVNAEEEMKRIKEEAEAEPKSEPRRPVEGE